MKYGKAIVPVSVSVAVVIAAVAAIVVTNNRAAVARAKAAEAESLEIAADRKAKEARANEAAAVARSNTAEVEKARSVAERETKVAEAEKAKADAIAAEKLAEQAKFEAQASARKAQAASDSKVAEQAKAAAAKAELDKETARIAGELAFSNAAAEKATAELRKKERETEADIAREKLLTLNKINFEKWERELIEYKQELDERERALHPDVSIYDSSNVTWVAEREADVIGGETNRLVRAAKVRPEDDPQFSMASRALAKVERLEHEASTNRVAAARAKIVAKLEKLRDVAMREGRAVDVDFYQKSLESLYPDYQK